jgi:serine/threonine protein kinase
VTENEQTRNKANAFVDQVSKLLGQGTFGKVVQARDRKRNKQVAIKIIRSVQKYRDASRIELRVLSTLKANDHENRNRCIHLRDCFDYRGHICIVMDLLGQSVFDFLKGNSFVPFPNSQIQSFARQLFTSVACKFSLSITVLQLTPLQSYTISILSTQISSQKIFCFVIVHTKHSPIADEFLHHPPQSIDKLRNVKSFLTPRLG